MKLFKHKMRGSLLPKDKISLSVLFMPFITGIIITIICYVAVIMAGLTSDNQKNVQRRGVVESQNTTEQIRNMDSKIYSEKVSILDKRYQSMTRILIIGDKDYIIGASDTRSFNKTDGTIHDDTQKIFKLSDYIFYTFSGQKLIPAAILENYRKGYIPSPQTFDEFISAFQKLATRISRGTPYPIDSNQFCIFGYDSQSDSFRVVAFQDSENYVPMESKKIFAILGGTDYIVFDQREYQKIKSQKTLKEKIKNTVDFMRKVQTESYNNEIEKTGKEPHANNKVNGVILRKRNGAVTVEMISY